MGPAPAVAAVRAAVRSVLAPPRRGTPPEPSLRGQPGSGRVLVACSGGPDSLALAAGVAFEAPRAGVAAGLVTVDHGLHPGSDAQAARVAALGAELGFDPVEVLRVEVGSDGGPEAAARIARYAALGETAAALDADVLLGHTLDDQAESVLLGLGRGSGPRSIAGMQVRDGRYLRPLLGLRRAITADACAALGLPTWHDPANDDPFLERVRLRNEVLPLLEDVLQGGVAAALARTAALVRDDVDALDGLASATLAAARPADAAIEVASVAGLPRAVRTRVLRAWAASIGTAGPLSAERTAALDSLITAWRGQGPVELPGAVSVRRESGRLVGCPNSTPTSTRS